MFAILALPLKSRRESQCLWIVILHKNYGKIKIFELYNRVSLRKSDEDVIIMRATVDKNGIYQLPFTQGQRKVIERLKSLFSNPFFIEELESILSTPNKRKKEKKLWKFAEQYGLSYEMGCPLITYILERKFPSDLEKDKDNDVCIIRDEVDEYLNENFPIPFEIPPSKLKGKRLEISNYPIHIAISPMASKRDVLDFINKRWLFIRDSLDYYGDVEQVERRRKKQERDDLIWENRSMSAKEIADLVNTKFPEENLTYADVHSILYYLRER